MACGCKNRALTIAGVDGGECDAPVKFPWPSDVDTLKARIGLAVHALDAAIESSCAELSKEDRAEWDLFLAKWIPFAAKETPLIGSYGEWVSACSYSHTVDAWRTKLAGKCSSLPGPDPIRGADTSAVKWVGVAAAAVAVVAVVGGGVYVARMFR